MVVESGPKQGEACAPRAKKFLNEAVWRINAEFGCREIKAPVGVRDRRNPRSVLAL